MRQELVEKLKRVDKKMSLLGRFLVSRYTVSEALVSSVVALFGVIIFRIKGSLNGYEIFLYPAAAAAVFCIMISFYALKKQNIEAETEKIMLYTIQLISMFIILGIMVIYSASLISIKILNFVDIPVAFLVLLNFIKWLVWTMIFVFGMHSTFEGVLKRMSGADMSVRSIWPSIFGIMVALIVLFQGLQNLPLSIGRAFIAGSMASWIVELFLKTKARIIKVQ